ncbi:MAG: hypothetical protein IK083_10460 [Abditibacteriota bacterium]|nr:hypothetical protein [Abditibacteriota bacterium]
MASMTTHERIKRMYEHREADRVPIIDDPWASTLERWTAQGMDRPFYEYFGIDRIVSVGADVTPRYEAKVIEETEDYSIFTSPWGVTMKNWKHIGGVPEFLDFTIRDEASWEAAKQRMVMGPDRIDWGFLEQNYPKWRADGEWLSANLWFGFDVTHSWMCGTERVLMEIAYGSEWIQDVFSYCLDCSLALFDLMLERGYAFDEIMWYDDMGYKQNTFFSLATYRNILKPVHRRACDWARERGMKVHLHSCGDVHTFIPDLMEIGVEMLNPVEVKAGMDPVALKKTYGDRLGFHGGINALLYNTPDKLWEEMERIIPVMKESGGYILSSDHSVPDCVTLEDFRTFTDLAKRLGTY